MKHHVLVVHGVGGHTHLSNLLRTYQSFRANLTSTDAPVLFEDHIPGWQLTSFEEAAAPPFLRLEPKVAPPAGSVDAVYLYEVNYSEFAGVIRRNHPLDLTDLFLGLDLTVAAARQRPGDKRSRVFGDRNRELGWCLQRMSGILTAGTVPIIGLPSVVFRDYIGTFIAFFTRFFEDVATFALDKNGEVLISAHLDRTIDTITASMASGDRLVVAAHSLGSVVVHNYIVRHWADGRKRIPDTVVTFGSPVGLLIWIWLFLDFEDMDFSQRITADKYFCWEPVTKPADATNTAGAPRARIDWINAVNCGDPIATAFPPGAIDLAADDRTIAASLEHGDVLHRYFGEARATRFGRAHVDYLNDARGFLTLLLRSTGLQPGNAREVPNLRPPDEHWKTTLKVLWRLQIYFYLGALAAIVAYCGVFAWILGDVRALWFAALFVWPRFTVGVLAFFQRLLRSGPTKRIPPSLIRGMAWNDLISFPYRLRDRLRLSEAREVDPTARGRSSLRRFFLNILSFIPTLAAMALPVAGMMWLSGQYPLDKLWGLWGVKGLIALAAFMAYVIACAVFELLATWRRVLIVLTTPANRGPSERG